jgi:uncharacterized membrane protein
MEPAQLAGTTAAAPGVSLVRAVPFSRRWCWPLLIGVVAVVATSPEIARGQRPVSYSDARAIVERRCVQCHSERPTSRAFLIAPQGVMLDTALQMQQYARRIEARAVVERTMPIANLSGMTDEERWVLARWVETGARIP